MFARFIQFMRIAHIYSHLIEIIEKIRHYIIYFQLICVIMLNAERTATNLDIRVRSVLGLVVLEM